MPRTASAFVSWFTGGLLGVLACRFFGPFLDGMKRWRNDHRLAGKKRGEKRRVTLCSAQVADAPVKKARVEAAAAKRAGEADEREKTKAAEAKKVAERRSMEEGLEKRRAAAAVAQKAALEAAAAAEKAGAEAAAVKWENEAAEKTKAAEAKKVAAAERRSMEEGLEKRRAAAAVAQKAALEAVAAAAVKTARAEAAAAKRENEAAEKTKAAEAKKVAAEEATAAKQAQLVPAVSYKDWRNDADAIERMHINYPSWVADGLSTMRRKQQLHTGDRSHRYIRKLDALTPTLTYSGCEEDARELEWPQPKSVDDGVCLFLPEHLFDNKLECMRRKQQDSVRGPSSTSRSHKNLRNLDEIIARFESVPGVAYKGWRNDADAIERAQYNYPSLVPAALSTMRRKQQLHTGDRSHRYIRKLDALTPTLTYSGCEEDARKLEWPQPESVDDGVCLFNAENLFDAKLEYMWRKQDVIGGRSHENLRNLDKVIAQFESVPGVAYKGWRNDADAIERMHINYPSWVADGLSTMRRKQQLHTGDRSHRYIRKLDALTPTLTYSGCEEDARELEWPQPKSVDDGVCLFLPEHLFDNKLECMRRKQDVIGGRSHKNLRNLDKSVARLARGMQIPLSSAPPSNSASSSVLWDAKELPIASLIECILGGKTCALSCLGMQPGLSHPPEEIRARFKVLALRVHPDKETHPRAEEAFVVVRAAYERLSAA